MHWLRSSGEEIAARCILRDNETRCSPGLRKGERGDGVGIGMYPLLYWSGVATLLVWSAYSAYSAFGGP